MVHAANGTSMSNVEHALTRFLTEFVSANKQRRFDDVLQQRTRHLTIVLEDLYLPQNSSACLRSCEAFGLQDVHVIENRHEFLVDREVARGGARWLSLQRHRGEDNNTPACLESLRQSGYRLLATVPEDDAVPIHQLPLEQKTALLFGHEKKGLSQVALDMADERVTIPMHGLTQSFNISVAVAVTLYELTTRLRQTDIDWHLSPAEMDNLRATWIRQVIGHKLPHLERRFKQDHAQV